MVPWETKLSVTVGTRDVVSGDKVPNNVELYLTMTTTIRDIYVPWVRSTGPILEDS